MSDQTYQLLYSPSTREVTYGLALGFQGFQGTGVQGPSAFGLQGLPGPLGLQGPQGALLQSELTIFSEYGLTLTAICEGWQVRASNQAWTDVAMSTSGQFQTATVENGTLFRSTNYGTTWTSVGTTGPWQRVAMDTSGKLQYATRMQTGLFQTNDFGVTWQSVSATGLPPATASNRYFSVSVSSNGQYVLVGTFEGSLYLSVDFGATFAVQPVVSTSLSWRDVVMSASGQYMLGVVGSALLTEHVYISSNFGRTWTRVTDPLVSNGSFTILGADMSASGQYVSLAGTNATGNAIVVSNNFGMTWSGVLSLATNPFLSSVAVSSTGQYQVATSLSGTTGEGGVYCSMDYGNTWTQSNALKTPTYASVAINGSGQYTTTVASNGPVYTCNNVAGLNGFQGARGAQGVQGGLGVQGSNLLQSELIIFSTYGVSLETIGSTWTQHRTPDGYRGVAMSTTGQYQFVVSTTGPTGDISRSTDYGLTYTSRGTNLGNRSYRAVASSASGQYVSAVLNGSLNPAGSTGSLLRSANFGDAFSVVPSTGNRDMVAIAISASGQFQVAAENNGYLWTSSDFGQTFSTMFTSSGLRAWRGVAMSASAQYMTAVDYNGFIYISTTYGQSWTQFASTQLWVGVAMCASGQYQVAVTERQIPSGAGQIFMSMDFGSTWMRVNTQSLGFRYSGITMNSTGQYIAASTSTGNVVDTSIDFGGNWVGRRPGTASQIGWQGVAINGSGQFLTAVGTNLNVFRSLNDGGLRGQQGSLGPQGIVGIQGFQGVQGLVGIVGAVGSQGLQGIQGLQGSLGTQGTQGMGNFLDSELTIFSKYGLTITGFATEPTWASVDVGVTGQYAAVGISTSGQFITVAPSNGVLRRSNNYGATWTASSSVTGDWRSIGMNVSGKFQLAGGRNGFVYYSNTFGVQWTNLNTSGRFGPTVPTGNCFGTVFSSDAKYALVMFDGNGVYVSSNADSGTVANITFTLRFTAPLTTTEFRGACMSASGQYMSFTIQNGQIYTSSDFGQTFFPRNSVRNWSDMSMSSNGQFQFAVTQSAGGTTGRGYWSNDFGQTFGDVPVQGLTSGQSDWRSCAVSATGQYAIMVSNSGLIASAQNWAGNFGFFTLTTSPLTLGGCAVNASGQYAVAVVNGGGILVSVNSGGLIGPQGFVGIQGFQGHQGFQGFQGFQGHQGLQGVQGFQGFQGFQGLQGRQGFQGFQGDRGLQGGIAAISDAVQYNSGGQFAGTSNFIVDPTTNYVVIGRTSATPMLMTGTLVQGGAAASTLNLGAETTGSRAFLVYANSGRYMEMNAANPNVCNIDFHSLDTNNNLDYDSRIRASGGSTNVGGGSLTADCQSLLVLNSIGYNNAELRFQSRNSSTSGFTDYSSRIYGVWDSINTTGTGTLVLDAATVRIQQKNLQIGSSSLFPVLASTNNQRVVTGFFNGFRNLTPSGTGAQAGSSLSAPISYGVTFALQPTVLVTVSDNEGAYVTTADINLSDVKFYAWIRSGRTTFSSNITVFYTAIGQIAVP